MTRRFLEAASNADGKLFFLNKALGMIHGAALPLRFLQDLDTPFSINDYRMGVVVQGQVHTIVNLTERHVREGDIVMLGPGTIVQPLEISADLRVKGLVVLPDFPLTFSPSELPAFSGRQTFLQLHPDETDLSIAHQLLDAVWGIVCLRYDASVVSGLVASVFQHWNRVYQSQTDEHRVAATREQEILEQFLRLVNQYAAREHQLHFYADRLCLTDRYLGTVVRQASGVAAKAWIDRALVMAIKVKLRHTDLTLKQIADELAFPNPSFFSKFFRRAAGQTPMDYRSCSGSPS